MQAWGTIGGAIIAAFGLFFIHKQIKEAVRSNRMSSLMAVLSLEESIAKARLDLSTMAADRAKAALDLSKTPDELKVINQFYEERIEQYLNVTDRLCTCIRRKYVDEDQYRRDYRKWIDEVVSKHKDRFGVDTRHHNIRHVHEKWSQDQSAVD